MKGDILQKKRSYKLAWIIHGSSLPQMRGTGYAAVVLHRKCPVTKQTSLRGAKRRGNPMALVNHLEIATLRSR